MPPKTRSVTCEICGFRICRIGNKKWIFMAKFPLDEARRNTVHAQRKYAHKAYMPYKSDVEPPETDQTMPAQPLVTKVRKPINSLLDEVAFGNNHQRRKRKKKKNTRVVFDQILTLEEQNADALGNQNGEPAAQLQKDFFEKSCSKIKQRKRKARVGIRKLRATLRSMSGLIQLRPRSRIAPTTILENILKKARAKNAKKRKKYIKSTTDASRSCRRINEKGTHEDNQRSSRISEKGTDDNNRRSSRISEKGTDEDNRRSSRISEKGTDEDNRLGSRISEKGTDEDNRRSSRISEKGTDEDNRRSSRISEKDTDEDNRLGSRISEKGTDENNRRSSRISEKGTGENNRRSSRISEKGTDENNRRSSRIRNKLWNQNDKHIHYHAERERMLSARVVLERISPLDVQNPPEPVPAQNAECAGNKISRQIEEQAAVAPVRIFREESRSPLMVAIPIKKHNKKRPRKSRLRKRKLSSATRTITTLKLLELRKRQVPRVWPTEAKVKQPIKTTKDASRSCRTTSETSNEDNRPLTHFAKIKKKPATPAKRKGTHAILRSASSIPKIIRKSPRNKETKIVSTNTQSCPVPLQKVSATSVTTNRPTGNATDVNAMPSNAWCLIYGEPGGETMPSGAQNFTKEKKSRTLPWTNSWSFINEQQNICDDMDGDAQNTQHSPKIEIDDLWIRRPISEAKDPQPSTSYMDAGPSTSRLNQSRYHQYSDPLDRETDTWEHDTVLFERPSEETLFLGTHSRDQKRIINPFADFATRIFNNDKKESRGGRITETYNSLSRVEEWLVNNNGEARHEPEIIVQPEVSNAVAQGSEKSITRPKCITWNHKTLSEVVTDKKLVKLFCGDCSRCRIMFKSEYIRKTITSTRPTRRVLRTSVTFNVNDSTTDEDDDPSSSSENDEPKNTIFHKISKNTNHVLKLRQIMTEKGKKIFKAAMIISNKIEANDQLLLKEQTILAEVIGILNECNANKKAPLQPVVRLTHYTMPSRRRLNSNDAVFPTSSKRLRQTNTSELTHRPPASLPPVPTSLESAQIFSPSLAEFKEGPLTYACSIQQRHPNISICGIKPPGDFSPTCTMHEPEIHFKVSNQYINRMLHRLGPSTSRLAAIRYIQTFKIQHSPLFEGLEVDLVKLFETVQSEQGLEACQNNKAKWQVVADKMNLYSRTKSYAKLENIYLKYLLSYTTLTSEERKKTEEEVVECWRRRDINSVDRAQNPLWRQDCLRDGKPIDGNEHVSTDMEKVCSEADECVIPGRSLIYKGFQKLADQVQKTYFPDNPTPKLEDVEEKYFKIVMDADSHVCVHSAAVDARELKCGFTVDPGNCYYDHPWNLKRLRSSPNNVLSYLDTAVGVPNTSLHYGMMFSTSCWHLDPTSVPWIEYHHSGPPRIWYSISGDQGHKFRAAAEGQCPSTVQNKNIWLPCDIFMIPPLLLLQYGITVQRHVQRAGEFVVVYPNNYTACIDTGLTITEGVYFAPLPWIVDVEKVFMSLRENCEPSLFSMEQLLIGMARSPSLPSNMLHHVHTMLNLALYAELAYRNGMVERNLELISPEAFLEQNQRATKTSWQIQRTGECYYCRCHLYMSRVVGITPGQTGLCAVHGLHVFDSAKKRGEQIANVYCIALISNAEIYDIISSLADRMLRSVNKPA